MRIFKIATSHLKKVYLAVKEKNKGVIIKMSIIGEILTQAVYYLVAMSLGLFVISFLQRGFFVPYMRVKLSFGALVLVKIREINRDLFRVGKVEEGFLIYKIKKDTKRIALPSDKPIFYRVVGTSWIDVDGESNLITTVDGTNVSGFDAVKYNNLFLRALYRPPLNDTKDKIILGLLIVIGIAIVIVIFALFLINKRFDLLEVSVSNINRGLVTASGGL